LRSSEELLGIKEKRHRTIVHELDLHYGPEAPGFHANTEGAQSFEECFVEGLSVFGNCRPLITRAPAFAAITIKGELGDAQQRSARFEQAAIHPTLLVVENPQIHYLFRQELSAFLRVALAYSHEGHESLPDSSYHFAGYADFGPANSLHNCTHSASPVSLLFPRVIGARLY